ncbi:MAG: (2Fe-2S)-binding protein [Alphaproteobacteria bacterium]
MMVCLCHPFSDKKVKEHLDCKSDSSRVAEVYSSCSGGNKPQCCSCLETVKDMVKAHNRKICSAA